MKILASIDDGSKLDMKAADLMDKYGIDCIFYIPVRYEQVNRQANREPLSDEDFRNLASRFEIGSHTINHPLLTRIDNNLADYEIRKSRELLQEMTGQKIESFCYPRGYYSYELRQMVEDAGYTSARTVQVGSLESPQDPLIAQTTVHVGYDRKEYGSLTWLEYAMNMLDLAREMDNAFYHLWMHSWEVDKNNGWEQLEALLKALAGK